MENKLLGYICIFRSIKNHWLWKDPVKFQWWIDILLSVNFKENKVLIRNQLILVRRGESIKSLHTWASEWLTTVKTVKHFFELLQSDGMIEIENLNFSTRITVCNYEDYQTTGNTKETEREQEVNTKGTEGEHNLPTNKKDNNGKKVKKVKKDAVFTPPTIDEVKQYFSEKGYTECSAIKAWDYYDAGNWKDAKGQQVKNWKQKMQGVWFKPENILPLKTSQQQIRVDHPEYREW